MLRLTLAQMRRSLGRLASAGIAIAIGTAFVAATLLAGNVITRTAYDAIAASYADADLVVLGQNLDAATVTQVRSTPGVATVSLRPTTSVTLSAGSHRSYAAVTEATSEPRLEPQTLASGAFPTQDGEIALPRPMAERLDVTVGDTVDSVHSASTPTVAPTATEATGDASAEGDAVGTTWVDKHEKLTVVGLVEDTAGAFSAVGGAVVLHADQAERFALEQSAPDPVRYDNLTVVMEHGADVAQVQSTLRGSLGSGVVVNTKDEQARAGVAQATGDGESVTTVVLGFAAVALVVAALVISNTFQVIVAQRTRTLALLRCVGASKRQLRRSVLFEASLLGLLSSAIGLGAGIGIVQIALEVLGRMDLDTPLPGTVPLSLAAFLVPMVVGTAVTLVACLSPARAATRVAPLAALRPADAPTLAGRASRVRLVVALMLTVGGTGLLLLAVAVAERTSAMEALGIGVLGGAISFIGVLIGAVLWIPRVIGWVGGMLARTGTSAKLAAANTVRNPRRTAATSTALLIGVTLVAMMSTGASSARSTLGSELDQHYPVDVMVGSTAYTDGKQLAVPQDVAARLGEVSGVVSVRPLLEDTLLVTPDDNASTASTMTVNGITAKDAATVVRDPAAIAGLADGTVVVSTSAARSLGIDDGATVTLGRQDDATGAALAGAPTVHLTARVTPLPDQLLLVTPATMNRVTDTAVSSMLWVRLADVSNASQVVPNVQDTLNDDSVQISGAAVERSVYQQAIDTLLAVVVGLLAIAVVIALVGVANTLSLSVIERRRESATLRAIGLKRSQLRWMLAIEGMLIAGVGAVLGIVLGTLYGWAGSATVLGTVGTVHLAVPWRDLGLVLLVAVVAGLLASVLPGRSAAKTSPVAALAVD